MYCKLKTTVAAVALCYAGLSHAAIYSQPNASNNFFPLNPRLSLWGGMGNNNYGRGDVMAPLFGSPSAIVYADADAEAGKNQSYLGSLGLGVRDAVNNDFLWGAYVFGDRSRSQEIYGNNDWFVVNPGVEFMTNRWDGRINGYFPAGKNKKFLSSVFADQAGMPAGITFNGHTQYSLLFDEMEEIGRGGDVDAGYTFRGLNRLRVHGGGYYFQMPDTANIKGAEAGVEMPVNKYITLELNNTYDNVQHNNTVVSLRFTLGGIKPPDEGDVPNVEDRILDPVERHLGTIYNSNGIPVSNAFYRTNKTVVERSNVWFFTGNGGSSFDPSAGTQNCTYEHPCSSASFTQTNLEDINTISAGANLYFSPGSYSVLNGSNPLTLYNGQSMYGRTADYKMPASSNYPVFTGAIAPEGNNTLDSFALVNNGTPNNVGVDISNANNIFMNNLQIGGSTATQSYARAAVALDNHSQNISLLNSTINNASTGLTAGGVVVDNNSSITMNNNVFNFTGNAIVEAGIAVFDGSVVNASGNIFNMHTTNSLSEVFGIANEGSTVNANDNIFNLSGTAVIAVDNENNGTTNLFRNTFNLSADGVSSMIIGIRNIAGTVNGNNNTFNFSGTAGTKTCGSFTSGSINIFNGC